MLAATTSAHAAAYPEAVLLVSGFDTASPFSTPDPGCDGKEGPEWSPAGGIAQTLKPVAKAVLVDHAERNQVLVTVDGSEIQISIKRPKVRRLRAVIWSGAERRRLDLDAEGRATLPEHDELTPLRIRARTKPGGVISSASTTLSR
jgi:hypothetical protein